MLSTFSSTCSCSTWPPLFELPPNPNQPFIYPYTPIAINAINKIAGDAIIPYPPGIPLVVGGEVITKECIDIVKNYLKGNKQVIGVSNNKISIVEE